MHGTDHPVTLSLRRYAEVLPASVGTDVLTGSKVDLSGDCLQLGVRTTYVLEF